MPTVLFPEITKCGDYPLSPKNKIKKELNMKSDETDLFSITNKEFFIALVKNPFDKGHQSATYHFILIFNIGDILVNQPSKTEFIEKKMSIKRDIPPLFFDYFYRFFP